MSNNILNTAKYSCSGCGACISVCPTKAIRLQLDLAGFYVAVVDEGKCVDCGLCKKVCTRYDEAISGANLQNMPLYALQSSDASKVKKCSSGGIAHELAEQALCQGKKVVGVIYNTETNRAEHKVVVRAEQLADLDGSKYLQSNPEQAFQAALDEARRDKEVQFVVFGTPCQIAGLAKASELCQVREQFLMVEIFCHGVPSYKLWDEECRRIRKRLDVNKFDSVQFRYKRNDWHSYCLRVDAGHQVFYGEREKELFWQVFFENILLGDSCYQCRMRKEYSLADIRLGDYWGSAFQHRSDGVSAVFVCTDRGQEAIRQLEHRRALVQLEATDAAQMLAAQNMDGYHQQELHDKAMEVLRSSEGALSAVKMYRAGMTGKQKLKRVLLTVSTIIPDNLRAKLRKANSSRQLNKGVKNEQ